MNLYNIQKEYLQLAEQLAEGEVTEELEQQLAINQEQLQHKGANYAYVIKQLEDDNLLLDKEIKRLTALKKSRTNAISRMKEAIKGAMMMYDITEIKTPTIKISFRKSEAVEIEDERLINPDYLNVVTTSTPDKVKIKEALKEGKEVIGAQLVTNHNLQIK